MPQRETQNTFYWLTWEVNSVLKWYLASLCNITKENFLSKTFLENRAWKLVPGLFNFQRIFFKGYLCYKTITSQYMSLWHRLRIFLFHRKVMFRSQDIEVFVFLTIPRSTKSVMSWWVLVFETRCIFYYIFKPQPIKSPNLVNWWI